MSKNVQIPIDLFFDIYDYFFKEMDKDQGEYLAEEICKQLNAKVDKLIDHELFSRYKTAPSGSEREKARQEYLDRRGIPGSFRTDIEQEPR